MKMISVYLLLALLLFGLVGCAATQDNEEEHVTFLATVVELPGNTVIVEPEESSAAAASASRIALSLSDITDDSLPQVGDVYQIEYDGVILETYPAQLHRVFSMEVVSVAGASSGAESEPENPGADAVPATEYPTSVAWVNWTENVTLHHACLNPDYMIWSDAPHLPVYKLESGEELEDFVSRYQDCLTFVSGYDEVSSFRQVTAHCDEAFFAENSLVMTYVRSGTGSDRFAIDRVELADGTCCVYVRKTVRPEGGTANMAGWMLIAEIPKADLERCTAYDAKMIFQE